MKILIKFILTLSFILPLNANASCSKPVVAISKGEPAVCTGFLFSPKQEEKMYLLNENSKILQEEVNIQKDYINSYSKDMTNFQSIIKDEKDKTELWRKAAETSTQKLIENENHTWYRDVLMVGLGVLITVGAGYAIGAAARN
jgi:hypothetical protein